MYQNEVEEFIKRRFPNNDSNWLNGNCYFFAAILKERFSNFNIYYLPITGHFVAGIKNEYYDWTGRVYPTEPIINFLDMDDNLLYQRLVRDCIM